MYKTRLPALRTGDPQPSTISRRPSVSLDWIARLSTDEIDVPPSADFIAPVTAGLNELLKDGLPQRNFAFVDALLPTMNPNMMRTDVMLAVVRTLFPVRSFLRNFPGLRTAVAAEMRRRNLNADRLLRGLF